MKIPNKEMHQDSYRKTENFLLIVKAFSRLHKAN